MSEGFCDTADGDASQMYDVAVALLDGTLSAEESQSLVGLLRNDAGARRQYVRFMCGSAKLHRWSMATAAAQDGHLNGTAACPTVDYSPIIGSSLGRFYLPLHGLLGSVTFCYVLAAMLTGAGILGAIALESAAVRSVAIKATTLVPGADAPRPDFLICFTKVIDCRWADPRTGEAEAADGKFALDSGILEITYKTGVQVILEGPAVYEADAENGGLLSRGKLTARVPERGPRPKLQDPRVGRTGSTSGDSPASLVRHPSPSFTLRTPSAVVFSPGGEFGIAVDGSGASRAHVFQGGLALQSGSGGDPAAPEVVLRENESARADKGRANRLAATIADPLWPGTFARRVARVVIPKKLAGNCVCLKSVTADIRGRLAAVGSGQDIVFPALSPSGGETHDGARLPRMRGMPKTPDGVTYVSRTVFEVTDLLLSTAELRGCYTARNYVSAMRFNGRELPGIGRVDDRYPVHSGGFLIAKGSLKSLNTLEIDVTMDGTLDLANTIPLVFYLELSGIQRPRPEASRGASAAVNAGTRPIHESGDRGRPRESEPIP